MEFNKSHLQIIDNLQLALRKCEIPGVKGDEMLALAQGYHFLTFIKQYMEVQMREQQVKIAAEQARVASEQAAATAAPLSFGLESPLSEVESKPKARKQKSEG